MQPAIYILSSTNNRVLYIGVTSNILQRVWQHKNNLVAGFTEKYNLHKLVHFEHHATMYDAITREKQLKSWQRAWKDNLIGKDNPNWNDLYDDLV